MKAFPWWASVILAIITYYGLKHGIPRLAGPESTIAGLTPLLAPIVAMGLLLLAAKQLYDNTEKTDPDDDGTNTSSQTDNNE